ncbi:hypothetical protein M427DRAFT_155894 [Gonapodya prolifera JEL478]|uniref:SH3 domain-containing protein n=1 Tax=Gonapodya prolifera (strain JEL478) TaxID=1344416 RepID=A0A139ACQ4_GONPJ|nr:hypothetical protein M427DRAFT_155894 [Gonapodya prolifera JEL478]|eukprot:KXS14592.1 hypothetical protein M427DRAFT_155894 [Gonapodya prolifera JEL478]
MTMPEQHKYPAVAPIPAAYNGSGKMQYPPQSMTSNVSGPQILSMGASRSAYLASGSGRVETGMSNYSGEWGSATDYGSSASARMKSVSSFGTSSAGSPAHWAFAYLAGAGHAGAAQMHLPEPNPVYVINRDYIARNGDELTIIMGSELQLHTAYRDGWGLGTEVQSGNSGLVPLEYLDFGVRPPSDLDFYAGSDVTPSSRRFESMQLKFPSKISSPPSGQRSS